MKSKDSARVLVSAAIIFDAENKILLSQRKLGKVYAGMWEFPGGKVEAGESIQQALNRELWEELGILSQINEERQPYISVEHVGDKANLLLHVFLCRNFQNTPTAKEGQKLCSFNVAELSNLQMPPADEIIIKKLIKDFT